MRRLGTIIPCIVFLLTACNEQLDMNFTDSSQKGYVSFDLTADMRNENINVKSSSVEDISTDDFWVEIFSPSGTRIFCEKYADAKDTVLHVNSGDHRFLATYGSENGVGFDAPYYKADATYTVGGQEEVQNISLKAKLANVKVAVEFDDKLDNKLAYEEYYALVRNNGKKLRFNPGETRAGYIPAGTLEFILYVKMDGAWKQFVYTSDFEPNDFVTYQLDVTHESTGDIVLVVKIDDTVEVQEVEIEIPSDEVLPIEAPVITYNGFDNDGTLTFVEGYAPLVDDMSFGVYAEGELESVTLGVVSEELAALGVPASVELLGADAATVAALEAAGIWWNVSDDNTTMGISITDAYADIISKAPYNYDAATGNCFPVAEFTLDVKGKKGFSNSAKEEFSITIEHNAPSGTFSYNDYDVWATKVVNPVLSLTNAENYARTTVQSSLDGKSWSDFMTVTAPEFNMGEITGLQAGTTYHLRAMYDGQILVAEPVTIKTEDAEQVGNAGFEDWTKMEDYTYDQTLFDQNNVLVYYKPWTSSQWWDTNATASMNDDITAAYTFFKTFPLVQYSTDAHSGKSAQLTVVNVGDSNSEIATLGTWYVGELFIGTGNNADGSGTWNKVSEGHSFFSRPESFSFWYEYDAYSDSDKFSVMVELRASDGTILASNTAEYTESLTWTQKTLPLEYKVTDKKAAMIYVYFKASTSSDHSCAVGGSFLEVAGSKPEGNPARIKLSATLRLDDITLNY